MRGMKGRIFKINIILFIFSIYKSFYIQEGFNPNIITNFTFGSNFYGRHTKYEDIFKVILKHNPNLWIWLGNAVDIDKPSFNIFSSSPEGKQNWGFVTKLYNKVKKNKYYAELNAKTPVIGTWGDYEYGIYYGNEENKMKESYKQHYLDFLEVDTLDQRRNQINTGIYSTYSFGSDERTVRIILLDLKYNKSPYLSENLDMLGEEQWKWLENIFKVSKESYTFIGVSNQIISHDRYIVEKWYQISRKKIFDLIGKYRRNGVIFLSGGIGFSQILKTFCPLPKIGYDLYEITSSGLGYNKKIKSFFNNFYHNDYLLPNLNYNEINFGQIQINWGDFIPSNGNYYDISKSYILLQIFNKKDEKMTEVKISYKDLIYKDTKLFYENKNNLKKIHYMNVVDDDSCEREIYHRVRTPFMIIKYYLENLEELPIALFTAALIIIVTNFLIYKPIITIFIGVICSGVIYLIICIINISSYYSFKYKILNEE